MRINKTKVIEVTSDLVDKYGLNNVSLKIIAEELGIRTPSLYNHIESWDQLMREVAHNGMRAMNSQMIQVAIGKTGVQAINAVSSAYFSYMIEHPGIYETIQWATWHGNNETAAIFNEYKNLLSQLIDTLPLNQEKNNEILDLLIGVLHGFTTMQLRNAFSKPQETIAELLVAIDTVLRGIMQKYA